MWPRIGAVILIIICCIISAISFYVLLCARRLGLSPPTFSQTEYYRGPRPVQGGIVRWVNDKICAFKNRNNRIPGGAYGELLLSNERGRDQGFGSLDPGEAWVTQFGTEADAYGPVSYYEEQELGISHNEYSAYDVERGRAMAPELYIGRNRTGMDKRYVEQMGKRPSKNPFGDNDVKPTNVSLRGVSPKPIDTSVSQWMSSWLNDNEIAESKIKIANGVDGRLVNWNVGNSQGLRSNSTPRSINKEVSLRERSCKRGLVARENFGLSSSFQPISLSTTSTIPELGMSKASQSKDAELEESTTKVIPHTCESCEKILIDLKGGDFLCQCHRGMEYDLWIGKVEDILQLEQNKCHFLLHLLHMEVRKRGKLQGLGLVKELGGDLSLKLVDDEMSRYNLVRAKTMVNFDDDYSLENFYVYAEEGDPAARYITHRPPNHEVGSEMGFELAQQWLRECTSSHTLCPKVNRLTLPTRVINISVEPPRLYVSKSGECGHYAALSYTWGGRQPIQTTTATLEQLMQRIPESELPRTLQDAILATQKLGLRYLWVDCLCIIQDDEEDNRREISKMAQVYKHAYVTISAACAESCHTGFLYKRPSKSLKAFRIPFQCPDGKRGSIILEKEAGFRDSEEPADLRGWILQESLLSPRLLTFGSRQIDWFCLEGEKTTGGYIGDPSGRNLPGFNFLLSTTYGVFSGAHIGRFGKLLARFHLLTGPKILYISMWAQIVSMYTRRNLSISSDRLPGISAIAQELAKRGLGVYLAGLWSSLLDIQLLWSTTKIAKCTRPQQYRAPSWSWASIDDAVFLLDDVRVETSIRPFKILGYGIEPISGMTTYTEFKSGFISVQGIIKKASLKRDPHFSTYFYTLEPTGYLFANVRLDAIEELLGYHADVWCLKGAQKDIYISGLILTALPNPNCYKRLGYFTMKSTHDWFSGCEKQVFTIY